MAIASHCVGSVAKWLARRTRDPVVADSTPTTAHVVIALGEQFTYIFLCKMSTDTIQ